MRPNKVEIEIEKEDNISEYKLEFKIKNEEGLCGRGVLWCKKQYF